MPGPGPRAGGGQGSSVPGPARCRDDRRGLSAAQVERARRWWKDVPGLSFLHADVCDYLASNTAPYDAIYSVWGAVWFTDPEVLFPLLAKSLAPGGVFAFSQAEPSLGAYGPQPMRGKWLEGRERELTVLRWQYPPEAWADLLKLHGFIGIEAQVRPAPDAEGLGTLLVRAQRPG
ncbi:class I SAM-dependent methyltransferase [Streptomyces anulatus]|uniref:class I SAM-dependent methyltransferase n=1 Tax=Streptomyces anulatus TaxID=1892 RepID=UPI0038666DF6